MKKLLAICVILTAVVFNIAAATPTVSASKVAFKYCEASYSSITIGVPSLPFEWNGHTFTESGVYVDTLVSPTTGCDSIVALHLTIHQVDTTYFEATSCDSYVWNGQTLTEGYRRNV